MNSNRNSAGDSTSACSSTLSASNTYENGASSSHRSNDQEKSEESKNRRKRVVELVDDAMDTPLAADDENEDDEEEGDYVSVGNALAAAVAPVLMQTDPTIGGMTFIGWFSFYFILKMRILFFKFCWQLKF